MKKALSVLILTSMLLGSMGSLTYAESNITTTTEERVILMTPS